MARAGYCNECKKNVWLTADGFCQFGHAPDNVSKVYEASQTSKRLSKPLTDAQKTQKKINNQALFLVITVIVISIGYGIWSSENKSTDKNSNNAAIETAKPQTTSPVSTPKPAPSPAPKPEPQPISLTGSGQQATGRFHLESGLSVFSMTHDGDANFAIWLLDSNGRQIDLLVNRIGPFSGSRALGIGIAGDHLLDIQANGNWSITITQPRLSNAPATASFGGNNQLATPLFSLSRGLHTFVMVHNGDANFAVWLLDSNGQQIELLVNDIGPFSGSKAVGIEEPGLYVLDVQANGDWSITIQ